MDRYIHHHAGNENSFCQLSSLKSITINHIETNSFDLPSTSWTLLHLKMSCLSGPELAHLVELLSDKSLESVTLEVLCSR